MKYKNEESILKLIKYAPSLFVLTLSVCISIFFYVDFNEAFQQEKQEIEAKHIAENKSSVKNEVLRVYDYINNQYAQTETRLKKTLKGRVYEAHAIATRIFNENKNNKSPQEIKKMIQDALVDIRFNEGRGYFYIYSLKYECILLPIARQYEGKSFYNFKEGTGRYLTREIIAQVKKQNEGFKKWSYHKPSDMQKQYPKLGFNKLFEPYNWFIGTGEYIDDFENDIKKDILTYINTINLDNNGYIFTFDNKGTYLTYFDKESLGENIIDKAASINVKDVFSKMKKASNNPQGEFIEYVHKNKPLSDAPSEKMSFIKGVDYWDWILGSGFYKDDIKKEIDTLKTSLNNKFHQSLMQLFLLALGLTLILLSISIYVSRLFRKRFYEYKQEIKNHTEQREKQQNLLAQQSKMAAMGEMIGNIAHQWRQPLSAITTASTGMQFQKEMGQLSDEDFFHSVKNINKSAQYLSQTIDDFRNFFKPDKKSTHFHIKKSIEQTLKLIEAQFKNKNIQIIQEVEDIEIYNLENEFIQVLLNILNNARDQLITHNEQEERFIFIQAHTKRNTDALQVILTVKDNGGGFQENVLQRVFEPYFTTKQKNQGTGIGLYMSQQIIEKHMKGQITAHNTIIEYNQKTYKGAQIQIIFTLSGEPQ